MRQTSGTGNGERKGALGRGLIWRVENLVVNKDDRVLVGSQPSVRLTMRDYGKVA